MELKRAVVETYSARKRYYNNLNQTENGSNYFWKIFIILLVTFILIILFIFCHRYIYGKIISSCKRCLTWRNKENNIDDNFPIMKESDSDSCTKRRSLWPNACKISTFRMKSNSQRDKQYENKCCKLKTLLPEKKKLLASCGNTTATTNNNVDLTKRLSLKMSFSSFSLPTTKNKGINDQTLNKWNIKNLENYKHNELSTKSIKHFTQNLRKTGKDICFSDTDLKFLVIPIPSKKSHIMKHNGKIVLCEWNSEDLNDYYDEQYNTSSKLIEFKFQNTDSFSGNAQRYGISNSKSSCSPWSFISKNLASDSKYFSDSVANTFDNLPNMYLTKLQRSSNSSASSLVSNISNVNRIKIKYSQNDTSDKKNDFKVLHVKSKENNFKCYTTDKNFIRGTDKLNERKSKIKLTEYVIQSKKMKKMKSSMDIQLNYLKENSRSLKDQMKEITSFQRKSKSDENLSYRIASFRMKNGNISNVISQDSPSIPEKLVYNNDCSYASFDQNLEASEICDELGILFSQYIKLQTQQCERKYCSVSRHLKQQTQHNIKKCQIRFNYHQIYPYDQRPACSSGNVCADTYDELKLMHTSPLERKDVYQCMFKRRKQFLNQPCKQNFSTTK